jgi:hypothetical protein
VKFDLWDDGTTGNSSNGDIGIYVNGVDSSVSSVLVKNCIINKGSTGISFDWVKTANIGACLFSDQSDKSADISLVNSSFITNTTFEDLQYIGVYVNNSSTRIQIANNFFYGKNDSASQHIYSIYINNCTNTVIKANTININNSRSGAYDVYGVRSYSGTRVLIVNNIINIESDVTGDTYGILKRASWAGTVSGNDITADAPGTGGGDIHGVYISVAENTNISNNTIDLVNNTANDFGIYLTAGTNNSYGDGNITYNCGTDIYDDGTGNNIGFQAA